MEKNGYIIFRNVLDENHLDFARNTIKSNGLVNYVEVKKFIDEVFFQKINSSFGWNCIYNKFRFSSAQQSNLKDAAQFHGDVYNFSNLQFMPIYTGLCYLDPATVEVIPGTHLNKNINSNGWKSKIQLNLNPGDLMIFHANLHHRGIPSNNQRRLLQIFEIFPNKVLFEKYNKNLLTVLTNKTWIMQFIHKNRLIEYTKLLNSSKNTDFKLFDKINYWQICNNTQYSTFGLDVDNQLKKNKFVGYEPGPRDIIKPNILQPQNINIIINKHPTAVPSCFYLNLFICLLVGLICWFVLKYITRKSIKVPNKLSR
jgi:hypothetical protein